MKTLWRLTRWLLFLPVALVVGCIVEYLVQLVVVGFGWPILGHAMSGAFAAMAICVSGLYIVPLKTPSTVRVLAGFTLAIALLCIWSNLFRPRPQDGDSLYDYLASGFIALVTFCRPQSLLDSLSHESHSSHSSHPTRPNV